MSSKYILFFLSLSVLISCSGPTMMSAKNKPLQGVNITIDPGHGDSEAYDNFRVGPSGEREEWINLRVAKTLNKMLSRAGANVLLSRSEDKDLSLGGRATLAKKHHSDLLISIHHNGSGVDFDMDLPIVYFFGPASQNPASVDFAKILIQGMREKMTFEQAQMGAVYSDYLIYDSGTSILRNTIDQMPGVIGEGGFFTHPKGEARLKSKHYNKLEAEVYYEAILKYFERGLPIANPSLDKGQNFLDMTKAIEFKLDDGLGSTDFDIASLQILQDGDTLEAKWDAVTGILSAVPLSSGKDEVTFHVFGRNLRGNALHPRPFTFVTEQGARWKSYSSWQAAFDQADSLVSKLGTQDSSSTEDELFLLSEAIRLYQVSLEIQIVHPKARFAEEQILTLLEMKQLLSGDDMESEIREQRQRLSEYYPD
ncbi:MAG: N-acetylmuramoyl-L-alanine amidase [Candidatus Marinimicrobia bacterium]|nr:N-acetylmuramoyl-L-alanine amidase [Candidatus Neomarinimicrobiota bacterium]